MQNCVKPCGHIVKKNVDIEAVYEKTKDVKLSIFDIQALPNMEYCITKIAKNEAKTEYGLTLSAVNKCKYN